MQIISGTKEFHIETPCAVTIGKFDGIHCGHREILSRIVSKRENGMKSLVLTFDPSPLAFFSGSDSCLSTVEEKRKLFENNEIDILIEYPFDKATADMEAEDFARKVLLGQINTRFFVAGEDLSFGKKGTGNADTLRSFQNEALKEGKASFEMEILPKLEIAGSPVSSSRIRECIAEGKMEEAEVLIGFPYQIAGTIVHGNQIGRTIGIPTINQIPDSEKVLPPFGVYVSEVKVDGERYKALTNIGVKPTVSNENKVCVETHIFDFEKDVYGNRAVVFLHHFLRPERKFKDVEELREQLQKDMKEARVE